MLAPIFAHAATPEITATPVLFDEKAQARDIINESFSITNTSDRTLTLFPSVNDIHAADGQQPFANAQNANQASASLANWIELSRGAIQLTPGEERTLSFIIRVAPNAASGQYHAAITFTNGSTRDAASTQTPVAEVDVNVQIQADLKELLQLNAFATDNIVFSGDDVLFKYQIQNIGNQNVDPKGEVRIYDRRGEEVATVDVNSEGKIIQPEEVTQLASVWSGASGFGQYKAVINVDYGSGQAASVQDVTYFWVIPWKELLGLTIFTLIGVIVLALYFHRYLEARHFGKLAAAGMIKPEALELSPHLPSQSQVKLVETIQEKKAWYQRFKRQGFGAPKQKVNEAPVPIYEKPVSTGTVNLKEMQMGKAQPAQKPQSGHVINLKF